MNRIDDQLARLFRAAAKAESGPAAPSYGLETRVLAAWRAAKPGDGGIWDMALLVRGLVLAVLIMGASLWPLLNTTTDPFAEYLQAADSTIVSDDAP